MLLRRQRLLSTDLTGIRIAVPNECHSFKSNLASVQRLIDAVKLCKILGATVDTVSLPTLSKALDVYYTIARAEAFSNLAKYDGIRYG